MEFEKSATFHALLHKKLRTGSKESGILGLVPCDGFQAASLVVLTAISTAAAANKTPRLHDRV